MPLIEHSVTSTSAPQVTESTDSDARWQTARVLRRVFAGAARRFRGVERRVGTGAASVRVLAEIAAHPNCRVGDVADSLYLSPSTVSNLVRDLQRRGWLIKSRAAEDQRTVRLQVTAEGRNAVALAGEDVRYFAELTRKLSDDEVAQVLEGLRILARHL